MQHARDRWARFRRLLLQRDSEMAPAGASPGVSASTGTSIQLQRAPGGRAGKPRPAAVPGSIRTSSDKPVAPPTISRGRR